MIIFASGRCDIASYYSEWFLNRLQAGFVDVRNPYNPHSISRILLDKEHVDCIVFCSKNFKPMLSTIHQIPYPLLFHVTLTPYHQDIEQNLPAKKTIVQDIVTLSKIIGKENVVLRYDPILLNKRYTIEYHVLAFSKLLHYIAPYIDRVIISFVDRYKNTQKNKRVLALDDVGLEQIKELAAQIGKIGKTHKIRMQTCAEDFNFEAYGIQKGACFDEEELTKKLQHPLKHKGKGVRKNCNCIQSVDIGDYNCCANGCKYCYANYQEALIHERMQLHDPTSSVLIGHLTKADRITIRK